MKVLRFVENVEYVDTYMNFISVGYCYTKAGVSTGTLFFDILYDPLN